MFSTPSIILSVVAYLLVLPSTIEALPFYPLASPVTTAPFTSPIITAPLTSPVSTAAFTNPILPNTITATQLLQVAPSSGSCAGAPYPDECRTASQAASALSASFQTYGITSAGEQAALISLIAYESGDFKYNKNHTPGIPGQGTRNMQSPNWNLLYASSLPSLSPLLPAIPATDVNAVRALILGNDEYDFGSAAWFLTTQCGPNIRSGLQDGGKQGWEAYVRGCVGATAGEDRAAYWERAKGSLGMGT